MDNDVTQAIAAIRDGAPGAAERLLPLVYEQLRGLAARRMAAETSSHTLQATALVHEAYLRLVAPGDSGFEGREHFFAAAAQAMRRILVDHARSRGALKRGGDRNKLQLDPELLTLQEPPPEIVELDAALERLEAHDPVKARLVTLRFFGGLSMSEAAELLGISKATAERHWSFARAWLFRTMEQERT